MELEDIFLAKFADITPDGLFTVVGGGVNKIQAGEFPWAWGLLFLLVRIRLTTQEATGEHKTAVERETPSGQVEPIGPEAPMPRMTPGAESGPDGKLGISFSVCLVNLLFPEPGVYKYRFKIDGREIGTADLLVTGPT
jgi:hypothetical protein